MIEQPADIPLERLLEERDLAAAAHAAAVEELPRARREADETADARRAGEERAAEAAGALFAARALVPPGFEDGFCSLTGQNVYGQPAEGPSHDVRVKRWLLLPRAQQIALTGDLAAKDQAWGAAHAALEKLIAPANEAARRVTALEDAVPNLAAEREAKQAALEAGLAEEEERQTLVGRIKRRIGLGKAT